ncbi:MAG TPA: glycosyltransferase [Streptosporangiaceae bacterium]|nr:glycosyltransferase [Streptosporangiaceae bacterium]
MHEVELTRRPIGALSNLLPPEQAARFEAAATRAGRELSGRTIWHVSSTAAGGGVAEMLHNLLGYFLDAGVGTRWLVLDADEQFFAITKHLHNAIHGLGHGDFTKKDHKHYEKVMGRNPVQDLVAAGDIVMLHDPQTAGLTEPVRAKGASVAWRSHIGRDYQTDASGHAWGFLRRYIEPADAFVFTRREYVPGWMDSEKVRLIPPSIDPLSAKNRELSVAECRDILGTVLSTGGGAPIADLPVDGRLVVQVSRWDRLKDMPGVMEGFRRAEPPLDVHLVLAGPAVAGVTDDPEGAGVFAECQAVRTALPADIRDRVHLASIPMDDIDRNALIVNALQREAAIIVQNSLAEGFGLTVTEAMWKARPVVATAVGGIKDQITSERTGVLVQHPGNRDELAGALRRLLYNDILAASLGQAAHDRVRDYYLDDRQLTQTAALFESLMPALAC